MTSASLSVRADLPETSSVVTAVRAIRRVAAVSSSRLRMAVVRSDCRVSLRVLMAPLCGVAATARPTAPLADAGSMGGPCQTWRMPTATRASLGAAGIPAGGRRRHHGLQPLGGAPVHAALGRGPAAAGPRSGLRMAAAPLRILHLSDLHLSPRDTDRIDWVRSLGELDVDLTVVTGDFHGDAQGPRLALRGPGAAARPTGAVRARVERLLRPSHGQPSQVPVRSQRAAHEAAEDRRHAAQRGPGRRRVAGPGQRDRRGHRPRLAHRCAWGGRPAHRARPVRRRRRPVRSGRRPPARGRPCALPAGARCHGRRRCRPDPGRPHPRRPGVPAVGRARWSPTATCPDARPRGCRDGRSPPCTSQPGWERARTPRSGWRAGRRRRC